VAIGAWLCLPRDPFGAAPAGAARPSALGSLAKIVRNRQVRLAAIIYAGGCGTMYGFGTMWNRPIALAWSLDADEARIVDFCFFLGIAIGAPMTGLIEGRLGARRALAAGIALTLAAFLFWVFVPIDLTVWFDLPARTASQRRAAVRAADRFEAQDDGFFERVRQGYQQRRDADAGRFEVLDAARSHAQVWGQLIAAVEGRGW
jgi:hypothetical protein